MEQRITLVTLGVDNLERAVAFYSALGWQRGRDQSADIAFFQAGPMVFALWGRSQLAEDCGRADEGRGFDGIVLAHNVTSPDLVDAVMEDARRAGATITREAAATSWGGHSGVFLDPDGHAWEIAHNPGWPLADDGSVSIAG